MYEESSVRLFKVAVVRHGVKGLFYPAMNGEKSLQLMENLSKRGLKTAAHTAANGISETLTVQEMHSIYSDWTSTMSTQRAQTTNLWSTKGGSDKLYNALLRQKGDGWVVDYSNGARGGTLRQGTRTQTPVTYEAALQLYEALVRSKIKDGYGCASTGEAYTSSDFADRATGLDVQLLTAIDEDECNRKLRDDAYFGQLKANGERRPLFIKDGVVTGANRTGLLVDIPVAWQEFAQFGDVTFDGEQVGSAYCVFDLLRCDGQDLRDQTAWSRYQRLVKLLDDMPVLPACLQLLEAQTTTIGKTRLLKHVRDNNLEGLVFKRALSSYTSGRSDDALKFKLVETATCIVVSHNVQRSVVIGLLDDTGVLLPKGNCTIPPNHPVPLVGALVDVSFLYFTGQAFEQPVFECQRTDLERDAARADRITRVKPAAMSEFSLF